MLDTYLTVELVSESFKPLNCNKNTLHSDINFLGVPFCLSMGKDLRSTKFYTYYHNHPVMTVTGYTYNSQVWETIVLLCWSLLTMYCFFRIRVCICWGMGAELGGMMTSDSFCSTVTIYNSILQLGSSTCNCLLP